MARTLNIKMNEFDGYNASKLDDKYIAEKNEISFLDEIVDDLEGVFDDAIDTAGEIEKVESVGKCKKIISSIRSKLSKNINDRRLKSIYKCLDDNDINRVLRNFYRIKREDRIGILLSVVKGKKITEDFLNFLSLLKLTEEEKLELAIQMIKSGNTEILFYRFPRILNISIDNKKILMDELVQNGEGVNLIKNITEFEEIDFETLEALYKDKKVNNNFLIKIILSETIKFKETDIIGIRNIFLKINKEENLKYSFLLLNTKQFNNNLTV